MKRFLDLEEHGSRPHRGRLIEAALPTGLSSPAGSDNSERPRRPAGRLSLYSLLARVLPVFLLWAMSGFFLAWYGRVLFDLPIFGDAAAHATISREFLNGNFLTADSGYPPLYHLLGALGMAVAGERGFIAVTVLSIVGIGVAVYHLAKVVTGSYSVALAAAFIAFISPKTAFYGGRLYMEMFLTLLFIAAFIFLYRYLNTRRVHDLVFCAILCALAAATKQQGLLLLAIPIGGFLAGRDTYEHWRGSKSAGFLSLKIFIPIVAVLVIPVLIWQIRSTGDFLPDSTYTAWANELARDLTQTDEKLEPWQEEWGVFLDARFEAGGYLELGTQAHESRHIWPWDILTNANAFFGINSHFWTNLPGGVSFNIVHVLILAELFVVGIIFFYQKQRGHPFATFLVLFLAMNYIAFIRNNDQLRYHVYIAFLLSFLLPLGAYATAEFLRKGFGNWGVVALVVGMGLLAVQYLPDATQRNLWYWTSQAYAPSVGGIQSIKDTSDYLNQHVADSETFIAIPDVEFKYYSQKQAVWEYRLYFLPDKQLRAVVADMNASYVVLPKSARQPDELWNHVGKAPLSFVERIRRNYPLVYTSDAGDIEVFATR